MSWLFSQALVAEYSEATCSDGAPSAPSNGPPTQQAYCSPDKMTAFSRLSRFGMTFKPLTEDHGAALLMSYLADSRARTSASPVAGQASRESAAACGSTWPALSVRYDPASSSWKTAHCLWEEDLPWSSVTLPTWGMTHSGFVYRHPTAERPISGTGAGLWRTPSAHVIDAKSSVVKLHGRKPTDPQVGLADQVIAMEKVMWPTPLASDAESAGGIKCWQNGNRGLALNTAVRLDFPTPGFNDFKSGKGYDHGDKQQTPQLRHISGGLLNPTWVEWLMGWPLGWTDLKPLAMDRFREWQQQHFPCCTKNKEAA